MAGVTPKEASGAPDTQNPWAELKFRNYTRRATVAAELQFRPMTRRAESSRIVKRLFGTVLQG
jgi:hypothetical protein